jgi:hypothetical protein
MSRIEGLFQAAHDETVRTELLGAGPAVVHRIAERGARISAGLSGGDSTRARVSGEVVGAAIAALPHFHGLDGRAASAARGTSAVKADGRAVRYADRGEVTGALVKLHQRASDDTRASTAVRAVEDCAAQRSDRRARAERACAKLHGRMLCAHGRQRRELRALYRAACHRLGIRP